MEGMFAEHGPCTIADDAVNPKINPWSWNLRANMIYIESPAGVGFSIAGLPSDYIQNDHS
jgi:cathepsin A (carboxypeptidase C)